MLFGLLALSFLLPFASSSTLKRNIDVCAFVDAELIINGIDFGIVRECVCLDIIDAVIQSNPVAKHAADKTSTSKVRNALAEKVNNSAGASQCVYPPHSDPVCTATDPCAYNCEAPYVKRGGNCVLPGSKRAAKRDVSPCSFGLTRCGVWSHWGSRSYECLDTSVELESCGGCAIPYGLGEQPTGMDCTQIQGVSDVECQQGKCVVNRCRPGWIVSENGAGCDRAAPMSAGHTQTLGAAAVEVNESVPAGTSPAAAAGMHIAGNLLQQAF